MLTPVPNSLKKSIDSMDYSKFTTFSETPSEEIMRLKNQVRSMLIHSIDAAIT